MDKSQKIQGYFTTSWFHLWFPYKGRTNQIKVDSESHMKHTVTELEVHNELIKFSHIVLGNYFSETNYECYVA
jgi:hypothetical protein